MKSIVSVLLLAVLVLFPAPGLRAENPTPAPNFALKTADGKTVELKNLAGKVVVVNFWATWCGPCRAEIPAMIQVYDQYRSKGLEIVGISLDREGWKVVTPYVEKAKITYPIVLGDKGVDSAYGPIEAIPATFIIDRKGNIVDQHVGAISKADFEKLIKRYL